MAPGAGAGSGWTWTKCAYPRTLHSLNVCNLASLLHLCTPLNAIYLTDMFWRIRLTQSVTTFVISKLIKLFVRKYLFYCLSWLFTDFSGEMKILIKDYKSSCISHGCFSLTTTHASRWEKLFRAPPLFLLLECFIDGISSLKTATNESAPWHSLLAAHLI